MRAKEFIIETVNPECFHPEFRHEQEFNGILLKAFPFVDEGKKYFVIRAYDKGIDVGVVKFRAKKNHEGNYWLESFATSIHPDYRGKNLARDMYAYAKMLGNDIKPSPDQSRAGRGMWQSWQDSGEAEHLLKEYKTYPTEDFEGLKMSMVEKNGQLIVKAIDDWGVNELGYVIFNIGDNDELDPQDLRVEDKYQGQGIAKIMYDYVKTHGYEIHRSYDQTDAGAGFWNKHRGEERIWEARSHLERNRKFDSGKHELYRWMADHNMGPRGMWGISMTMLPKLGINPGKGVSEDTPKGIYFYPIWYIVGWLNGNKELPWGSNFPYIQLFQYDDSHRLTQQTQVNPEKVKQALRQYCPEEIIEQTKYNGDAYWFIYNCLVQLGKGDETTIIRWNKVLRDLGFTSVLDEGAGWIAHNEPVQGIILDPRIIKQVKTFNNYNRTNG